MAVFKASLNFWSDGYGWGESFYWQGGSMQQALQNVATLGEARAPLLAQNVFLTSVEVSDLHRGTTTIGAAPAAASGPRTLPWSAVNCLLVTQEFYRRSYLVRGLPGGFYRGSPGQGTFDPGVLGMLNAYLDQLSQLKFCLKVLDRGVPRVPITAIGPDVPEAILGLWQTGFVELTTATPHGLALLDAETGERTKVGVHNVKWSEPLPRWARINGTWRVMDLAGNFTVYLDGVSVPPSGFYYPGGVLAPRVVAYKVIDRGGVVAPTMRATGRG